MAKDYKFLQMAMILIVCLLSIGELCLPSSAVVAEYGVSLRLKGKFFDFLSERVLYGEARAVLIDEPLGPNAMGLIPNQFYRLDVEVTSRGGDLFSILIFDDETGQILASLEVPLDGNKFRLARRDILYPKVNQQTRIWVIIAKSAKDKRLKIAGKGIFDVLAMVVREKMRRRYPFELSKDEIRKEIENLQKYLKERAPKEFVWRVKEIQKYPIIAKLYRFGFDLKGEMGSIGMGAIGEERPGTYKGANPTLLEIDLSPIALENTKQQGRTQRSVNLKYLSDFDYITGAREPILTDIRLPELLFVAPANFVRQIIPTPIKRDYAISEGVSFATSVTVTDAKKLWLIAGTTQRIQDFYCIWVDPASPYKEVRKTLVASYGWREWGNFKITNVASLGSTLSTITTSPGFDSSFINKQMAEKQPHQNSFPATGQCCPSGT